MLPSHRDEIAGCIEKAYEKILFAEATRILFFSTPKKMTDYAKKVARVWDKGLQMRVGDGGYRFLSEQWLWGHQQNRDCP